MRHLRRSLALVALGLAPLGCSDESARLADPRFGRGAFAVTRPTSRVAFLEPEFSLVDANPSSATHDLQVSPRQHLGHVSAWYFGHAT